MVLVSIALVQPAVAQDDPCMYFEDPYGCDVWVCEDVLNWHCPDQDGYGSWPMP